MWFRRPRDNALVGRPASSTSRSLNGPATSPTPRHPFPRCVTTFANQRKGWAYRQDQLPTTHPIAADMVDLRSGVRQLRRHHLREGRARVAWQLVAFGGRGLPQGTAPYFAQYAWSNTSLNDLLTALSPMPAAGTSHTGPNSGCRPLGQHAGPRSRPARTVPWARWQFWQSPPALPEGVEPTLRDHRIAIGLYELREGALERTGSRWRSMQRGQTRTIPRPVGTAPWTCCCSTIDDLTFIRSRLDEHSLRTISEHRSGQESAGASTSVGCDRGTITRRRRERMSAGAFLDALASGIADETEVGMVQRVLRRAERSGLRRRTGAGFTRSDVPACSAGLMHEARPGSDLTSWPPAV